MPIGRTSGNAVTQHFATQPLGTVCRLSTLLQLESSAPENFFVTLFQVYSNGIGAQDSAICTCSTVALHNRISIDPTWYAMGRHHRCHYIRISECH